MAPGSTQHLPQQTQQQTFDVTVGRPPTSTRRPAIDADEFIAKPGVPRANAAVSTSSPQGNKAYTERHKEHTVLQQHCLFFDRDADGQIFPWDTYVGFRELGFNIIFSMLAMVIIHTGFSYPTRLGRSYVPDPLFRVYLDSIHKAKHGSDSGTYDTEGRFRPQQFEDMFAKYDGDGDGALTFRELFHLMSGNRNAVDPFGWFAALFEFGTTYLLVQLDGKVHKEDLRGVYDGSIFFRIRDRRLRTKAGWNQGYGLGGDGFIGNGKSASLAMLSL